MREKVQIIISNIKDQLEIDIRKYENDLLFSKIRSIMMIQNYSFGRILNSIFVSLILYILGFMGLDLYGVQYFIYGVFGLILFLILGLLYAVVNILSNLKNDLIQIIKLSTDTLENVINDLEKVPQNMFHEIKQPLSLLFEGIIFVIISPQITKITNKIPFIGGLVSSGVYKVLSLTVSNFKQQENKLNLDFTNKSTSLGIKISSIHSMIKNFLNGTEKTINKTIGNICRPFKFLLYIVSIILLLFVWIIN